MKEHSTGSFSPTDAIFVVTTFSYSDGELPLTGLYRYDPDRRQQYERFNASGDRRNGGIWSFVCGFYFVALVAAGHYSLTSYKLAALTKLVRQGRDPSLHCGFNEWCYALDGVAREYDWQSWSVAMYLDAAASVEQKRPPFFVTSCI